MRDRSGRSQQIGSPGFGRRTDHHDRYASQPGAGNGKRFDHRVLDADVGRMFRDKSEWRRGDQVDVIDGFFPPAHAARFLDLVLRPADPIEQFLADFVSDRFGDGDRGPG